MTVLEHLSEALLLDRMERANSPVSLHIQNALNTFGRVGQDEIRKANAARQNRTATSTAKPAAQDPRSWNPVESLGKFQGLPTSEVVQSSPERPKSPPPQRPSQENPQSEKQSVPVAEISVSKDDETTVKMIGAVDITDKIAPSLANAKRIEIPNRPSKVLEKYGIEQIRGYLKRANVEVSAELNDKEIAALLIQNFKPGK